MAAIAVSKNATAAQLSLAWLYERARVLGVSLVAIPGSTNLAHIGEDLHALKLNLDEQDMAALEGLANQVSGLRGTEWYMDGTYNGKLPEK